MIDKENAKPQANLCNFKMSILMDIRSFKCIGLGTGQVLLPWSSPMMFLFELFKMTFKNINKRLSYYKNILLFNSPNQIITLRGNMKQRPYIY